MLPRDDQTVLDLWQSVRDAAIRRGADPATAEDVAQETWLRALSKPPEERGRLRGWLHVVARRILRDGRRRGRERLALEHETARPERSNERLEALTSVQARLERLPEPYRVVVRMRFIEERQVEEIATILGLHPEAVRSRLKRGLGMLRERLEEEDTQGRGGWPALFALRLRRWLRPRPGAVALISGTALLLLWSWSSWVTPSQATRVAPSNGSSARLTELDPTSGVREEPDRTPPEVAASVLHPPAVVSKRTGVVRTSNGEPVAGAEVFTAAEEADEFRSVAVTDARGRFEAEIPAGWIWASAADWCPSDRYYTPTLPAGEIELDLSPTRGRAWVLVVDQEKNPVRAEVALEPPPGRPETLDARGIVRRSPLRQVGSTDDHGLVELVFPEQPSVELCVTSEEAPSARLRKWTPSVGETLRVITQESTTLEGTCLTPDGAAAAGVSVTVQQCGGALKRSTTTDEGGAFRFEKLALGYYALTALEPGSGRTKSAVHRSLLEKAKKALVELRLEEHATIEGTVLDDGHGVANATVRLRSTRYDVASGFDLQATSTDELGYFRFVGVHANVFELSAESGARRSGAVFVEPGVPMLTLELRQAPEKLAPLEFEFLGNPDDLPAWLLIDFARSHTSASRVTPAEGSSLFSRLFRSAPLPAGSYEVSAWSPSVGLWTAGALTHAPPEVSRVQWLTPVMSELTIHVDLPEGVSSDSLRVQAWRDGVGPEPGVSPPLAYPLEPRGPGTYTRSLAPGNYSLRVTGPGLADESFPLVLADGVALSRTIEVTQGYGVSLVTRAERFLSPRENVHWRFIGPSGTTELDLQGQESVPLSFGQRFFVNIPLDCTRLEVWTEPHGPLPGLRGMADVPTDAPGENEVRRIAVKLAEAK